MTVEDMIYDLEAYDVDQELSLGYSSKGKLCVRVHSGDISTPVVHTIYLSDMRR